MLWLLTGFALLPAWAHGIVGERMFIEPLFTEDANVKNELVFPFAQFGVQPDGTWRRIGFSIEKQLYPNRFSAVLETGRLYRHDGVGKLSGWDNLEAGVKLQAYTNEHHEFVVSPALFVEFPTSSERVAEHETSLSPMLLYGKGLGDLSTGWLRPFAIQGDVGIAASLKRPHDRELLYDAVIMYSIPYLNHNVRKADSGYSLEHSLRQGFSAGALLGNLFPYVEFNGLHPVGRTPGGVLSSLRPGIVWMGKYVQVSFAADLPVQSDELEGRRHRGFCASLDWFLDEVFPALNWTPFGKNHNHAD
jgi:hypothetical protein